MTDHTESLAAAAIKLSPPASVAAGSVAGVPLQDWVYALTLIYTVLLIAQHVWSKWYAPWRDRKALGVKIGIPPE